MSNITLVIPIYNDAKSMAILVKKIETIREPFLRFLFVDNGSSPKLHLDSPPEGSCEIALVRSDTNLGFGGGILYGIAQTTSNYVGWMPGNLKIDPCEVARMISHHNLEPNILLKASRSGRKIIPRVKTYFAGIVQSALLRKNMLDSGGTPTVCSREFISNLRNPPRDYVFESFVLYKARQMKMNIVRPNITYGTRVFGQSHWQRGLRSEVALLKLIYVASKEWAKNES
jgi:glycosyltransferase involved in cell wall biosynthesis